MKALRNVVFACCLMISASALAQDAPAEGEDAADSRATSFQAVEGPEAEQVPGGPLLVGAYGFVLVLLVAYVARLGSMQTKTSAEVERLSRTIAQGRKG